VLAIAEVIYSAVAFWLNWFENHRVQSTYETHLMIKTFLLQFVANNSAPFFVAFIKGSLGSIFPSMQEYCSPTSCCVNSDCSAEVESLLLQVILTKSVMNAVTSYVRPAVLGFLGRGTAVVASGQHSRGVSKVIAAAKAMRDYQEQCTRPEFEGTLLLYQHLMNQFAFVMLFASAAPLGPLVALISNVLWLRGQSSTLLKFYARPRFRELRKGPSGTLLTALTFISIATNAALLLYTFRFSVVDKLVAVFVVEHVMLVLWLLLFVYIPAVPGDVKKQLAKARYIADLAVIESQKKKVD
jgi:hypothetical protein